MFNKKYLIIIIFIIFLLKLYFSYSFPVITGDWAYYNTIANNILSGCGVSLSTEGEICAKHFGGNQGPGYPFFISIIYFVFGKNTFNIIIIQNLILALSQFYLLSHLEKKFISKKFFIFSIFVICLSPLVFAWSRFMLTEPITIAITYLLIAYMMNPKRNIFFIGLILSLGTYIRLDFILMSSLIFYLIAVESKNKTIIAKKILQLTLIIGLAWTPWLTRNYYAEINIFPSEYPQKANFYNPKGFVKWTSTWVFNSYQRAGTVNQIMSGIYSEIDIGDKYYFDDEIEKKKINKLLDNLKKYDHKSFPRELDEKFNKIAKEKIKNNMINYYFYLPSKRLANIIFNFTNSHGWPIEFSSYFSQEDRIIISEFNILDKAKFAIQNFNQKIFYKIVLNSYKILIFFLFFILILTKHRPSISSLHLSIALYFMVKLVFMITFNHTEIRYLITCFALLDIPILLKLEGFFINKNKKIFNT